jgi:hypothetical protein
MGNLIVNRELIENILNAEVERTKGLYEDERAHFKSVAQGIPRGIPNSDNVTRIRQAAERHNRAIDAYRMALSRFNDYVIRGIIPVDLKTSATDHLGQLPKSA